MSEPRKSSGQGADAARLADRVRGIEPSGIRRIFELMATMEDPINLSIGQPHYDPPVELVEAACRAIRAGKNRYTVTQGLPELNARVLDDVARRYGHRPETCLLTAGVSGGLVLTFQCLLNPGDEILLPDPGFVMYRHLATLCGATVRYYDLYPKQPGQRFGVDLAEIEALCGPRTKIVFVNSPSNPTGAVLTRAEIEGVCAIANRCGAYVVSDEIYDFFCFTDDYASPVSYAERCIQLGGYSKTYGIPGWRMGYATGPANVLDAMKTLQQFSFVCAPAPFQYALLEAEPSIDLSPYFAEYRQKRDFVARELHPVYALSPPEGSFYAFPQLPTPADGRAGDAGAFLQAALDHKLLIVPGKSFSRRDTHFRISFAADDELLARGIAVLNELAPRFA
ncbi:MAG: pyridoxal phosphate-dependent aminotransferase [Planctomycetes bacterium]|nr:pyridoxal phosphate-dependent aminotransferase [Planctomycetota bacterium]